MKIIVDSNGELVASDIDLVVLVGRIEALEEECKQLRQRTFSLQNQLDHQVPRINDIEDKIDWRK